MCNCRCIELSELIETRDFSKHSLTWSVKTRKEEQLPILPKVQTSTSGFSLATLLLVLYQGTTSMITGMFLKITGMFGTVNQGALSLAPAGLMLFYWTGADL
jgi:hypothetical protein